MNQTKVRTSFVEHVITHTKTVSKYLQGFVCLGIPLILPKSNRWNKERYFHLVIKFKESGYFSLGFQYCYINYKAGWLRGLWGRQYRCKSLFSMSVSQNNKSKCTHVDSFSFSTWHDFESCWRLIRTSLGVFARVFPERISRIFFLCIFLPAA